MGLFRPVVLSVSPVQTHHIASHNSTSSSLDFHVLKMTFAIDIAISLLALFERLHVTHSGNFKDLVSEVQDTRPWTLNLESKNDSWILPLLESR